MSAADKVSARDREIFLRVLEADRQRARDVRAEVEREDYDQQVAACVAARDLMEILLNTGVHPVYILGGMAMTLGALCGRWSVAALDPRALETVTHCFTNAYNWSAEKEREGEVVGHA